jgi:cellulose synthase/poly-beta-1,6-N-acetylglucosamine synthase-like glycosyltransferase
MTSAVATDISVAVIVCAYTLDRLDDLTASLDAVHAQSRTPDEVVCVIDHNDLLLKRVTRLADQRDWHLLTVVDNTSTQGLSGARNVGVAATGSEIVVFIDDDATAHPDWLRELVAPFADANVAGTGGRIEPAWPDTRPSWFPAHLDWTVGCSIPTLPEAGGPIRNMYGASAAFRRSALDRAGQFPTELGRVGANGAGCEETEVCIKIRQQSPGSSIMYAPKSLVAHRVTDERATIPYVLRRCLAEGRSKARLAQRVGAHDATGDERGYAVLIIRAVGRDLAAGLRHPSRWVRAAVLVGGLGAASLGYLFERVRSR